MLKFGISRDHHVNIPAMALGHPLVDKMSRDVSQPGFGEPQLPAINDHFRSIRLNRDRFLADDHGLGFGIFRLCHPR